MAKKKCVEKGKEAGTEAQGLSVVVANQDDTIEIPGIDSCLAIISELDDGRVVAGHALNPWGVEEDQNENGLGTPQFIVTEMKKKIGEAKILKTTCFGDGNYISPGDPKASTSFEYVKKELDKDCIFNEKGDRPITVMVHFENESWVIKSFEQ